jgi:GT2 family glycosyltransferase
MGRGRTVTAARPSVSVVIPTHDTRDLTLRCLDSVARNPADGVEIVLVDDGSRDDTGAAVARLHPHVRVLRRERASGFSAAANQGLAEARGDILFLLNSDTEVEPEALARVREAFAAQPRLGVAGACLVYPDGRPQWSGGPAPNAAWLFLVASGIPAWLARVPFYTKLRSGRRGPVDWVSGAAMAIRRAAWDAIGPLDEGFAFYAQDVDLCLRARDAGWSVALLPELRVTHHHGATIGRQAGSTGGVQPALMWTDLLRLADKRGGVPAARRAAGALRAGARLRLLGFALERPFVAASRREPWRVEREAFRAAARALAATASVFRGAR